MSSSARTTTSASASSSSTRSAGRGPSLHTHPYEELLIVLEGELTLDDGTEKRRAGAGDVVPIPPGQPHGFVNSGDGRLRQIDVHVSPRFSTNWLT
jgi:mannose-6-phosphate isomerase-like protein (cupin superfamily)